MHLGGSTSKKVLTHFELLVACWAKISDGGFDLVALSPHVQPIVLKLDHAQLHGMGLQLEGCLHCVPVDTIEVCAGPVVAGKKILDEFWGGVNLNEAFCYLLCDSGALKEKGYSVGREVR